MMREGRVGGREEGDQRVRERREGEIDKTNRVRKRERERVRE